MSKRKIYILLLRFHDKGTKVIHAFTGSYYPHASIGLGEDLNTFYSFVSKGFIVEKITRYVKPDRRPFPCQLYELSVTNKTYKKIKCAIERFVKLKSCLRYTKLGLILSMLHIPYKKNRFSFFCSHFVAELLERCGAVKLKMKSNKYFSNDLKRLSGMKLVYQGDLKSMACELGLLPRALKEGG